MLHLFKYRFLQNIRQLSLMFWALFFPLILATFFYVSFGSAGIEATGESSFRAVKVAVVQPGHASDGSDAFLEFLEALDPDVLDIQAITDEHGAAEALEDDAIDGIFYLKDSPSLTVAQNGLNESILTTLLHTYNQNASMLSEIAALHPEKLTDALDALSIDTAMTREVSAGGSTLDPNIQFFFALIAYACLSGAFLGVRSSCDGQANLSALGARRSITPTHKLKLILTDMLVLFLIHFFNILILNLYIGKLLGIHLGDDLPSLLLVNLMGSMIGVCIGVTFGCVSKLSLESKISLTVAITLVPGFLAGLMFGEMKNLIELHCPVINRINPAAVLSDAFYCMGVYNDTARFHRCILILGAMCILLLIIAFLAIRRERYDNI